MIGFGNAVVAVAVLIGFYFNAFRVFLEAGVMRLLIGRVLWTVKEISDNAQLKEVVIKGLGEAQVRGLSEPISSVTENRTRSFEPIHRETKTQ